MKSKMILGNYIENVKCESYKDLKTSSIRVRPMPGQGLPTDIRVECDKKERKAHPEGTIFRTENVKVCQKPNGTFYLRAKDQMIYKLK